MLVLQHSTCVTNLTFPSQLRPRCYSHTINLTWGMGYSEGWGSTKFPQCKGSLEPIRAARDRRLSLLTGTKNQEGAQCSRVAAHGLCRQWVTNRILICTSKGCSHPVPCLVLGFLSFFCLAHLATSSRETAVQTLLVRGFLQSASLLRGWGQNRAHLEPLPPGTASSFGFGVTCKERAFTGR